VTRLLARLGTAVLGLTVVALAAGQVLGQPVLFGFVETGSMAPTLAAGDGFIAVPAALAGPVEPGDVVVFRAETVGDGGLTTHRVVDETDRGYVTQGDANPFTDQASGEPPVRRAEIVAVAWAPGGQVLAIPQLGTGVLALRAALDTLQTTLARLLGTDALLGPAGIGYLIAGAAAALYAVDWLAARRAAGRDGDRSRARPTDRNAGTSTRVAVAGFTLLLLAGATVAMVGPAGPQQYEVTSAEFDSDRPTVVRAGETTTVDYRVTNSGVVPVVVYVTPASRGVTVPSERLTLAPRSTRDVAVTLSAPAEIGAYDRYVVEHRYLALLPVGVIDGLYRVHPWTPVVVIDALVGIGFYLLAVRLVGRGRVRLARYDRPDATNRPFER
jgi:signal peptidase